MRIFAGFVTLISLMPGVVLGQQPSVADRTRAAIVAEQVHINDAGASLAGLDQIVEGLIAENARLEQRQRDFDAYLKACGDQPGCTQPVTAGR